MREAESLPAPIMAMIEGGVWGGACEVALACDLLTAAPNATFAITPSKLGVSYHRIGNLTRMKRVNMAILEELSYTAEPSDARHTEHLGIINYVVDTEQNETFPWDLAHSITQNSPLSISVIKEELRLLAGAHHLSALTFNVSGACIGGSMIVKIAGRASTPFSKNANLNSGIDSTKSPYPFTGIMVSRTSR